MKLTLIAVAGTVITLSFSALAEDMPGMKMDGMEGMQMKQDAKQAPVAKAEGTIKAINAEKHTVTIAHGAVPAVQWPPMTMAFSVTDDQLTGPRLFPLKNETVRVNVAGTFCRAGFYPPLVHENHISVTQQDGPLLARKLPGIANNRYCQGQRKSVR
jgi:Cu(I)/Ag(I) efflux system protein CusF